MSSRIHKEFSIYIRRYHIRLHLVGAAAVLKQLVFVAAFFMYILKGGSDFSSLAVVWRASRFPQSRINGICAASLHHVTSGPPLCYATKWNVQHAVGEIVAPIDCRRMCVAPDAITVLLRSLPLFAFAKSQD